jgi:two-component sensor histidine kinase
MEQSLFVELIHRTKSILDTISKLTQLSRVKSGDREFGEFFYKAVTRLRNIILLNTFLVYRINIDLKDTLKTLIRC